MVPADIVFIVCDLQMRESAEGRRQLESSWQETVNIMFTEKNNNFGLPTSDFGLNR